jgi:hypothetical protein
VVLDVTAKTQDGTRVFSYRKVWQEIGTDLKSNQQYKSWDQEHHRPVAPATPDPHREPHHPFPVGTGAAEIEAIITYHQPGEVRRPPGDQAGGVPEGGGSTWTTRARRRPAGEVSGPAAAGVAGGGPGRLMLALGGTSPGRS